MSADKATVDLEVSLGACEITVWYCMAADSSYSWNYTYQNSDGKSAHIVIPPQQRLACLEQNSTEKISITLSAMSSAVFLSILPIIDSSAEESLIRDRLCVSAGVEQCQLYYLLWVVPDA